MAEALRTAIMLISPIAPHIAENLWQAFGETELLVGNRWPQVDESALIQNNITLVVQVNGKVRAQIDVAADADKSDILGRAKSADNVVRFIAGKEIRKEIVVPGKLVNIVVG